MTYRVVVYEFGEGGEKMKEVKVIGKGMSEHKADRVERGVLINLDTERFCVVAEEEE